MPRFRRTAWCLLALAAIVAASRGDDPPTQNKPAPAGDRSHVYGEWRIRVRPDQGPAYNRLIEDSGLPLFREAGGRMVGWWKTMIGDLYEHVTIWEYDDMAAFERAGRFLSRNAVFRPVRRGARPAPGWLRRVGSCGWPRAPRVLALPSQPHSSYTRFIACGLRAGTPTSRS